MNLLKAYFEDGANHQAQAVLAFLKYRGDIESSWNKESKRYDAEVQVSRWENCREQGYVVMLKAKFGKVRQLNVAFFEHRNSDNICAIKWEQWTTNAPTIDTAKFGGKVYNDKYDVSHDVGPGKADEMAQWIHDELTKFWDAHA